MKSARPIALILAAWLADPYGIGGPIRYLTEAAGYILASLGAYMAARALLPLSLYRVTAVFGALALITFYAFEAAPMAGAISALSGVQLPYPATGYFIVAAAVAVAANGLLAAHGQPIRRLRRRVGFVP